MNSVVLSTANSRTEQNHKLRLNLTTDLKLQDNLVSLSHCSIYYNWKNIRPDLDNDRIIYTHLPSGNVHLHTMPEGSYSIADINNFLHQEMRSNGHQNADGTYDINLYANNVYNRVTITISQDFQISFAAGLMTLLGLDQSQFTLTNGEFNGNLVPKVEVVDTILIHCNLVNNQVVHDSSIIYSFVPNQSFGTLLEIKPNFSQWRFARNATFNSIEVWFTDQDNKPLDVEDNILVELQIKVVKYNLD